MRQNEIKKVTQPERTILTSVTYLREHFFIVSNDVLKSKWSNSCPSYLRSNHTRVVLAYSYNTGLAYI